ncbi:Mitochondrial inner membrane protease atp23 [Vanrija albida]|uniref:Mitochondrial inner membrane protease atp23 n=1 Tax=Vanrija albida TaxID=181172 RepID=A0ABR3QF39_9TREE
MAVFQVLGTPELVSDTELVDYVARKLEKNGAGKLARRLRRSVEIASEGTPGDKVRLWSDPRPADAARRPPTFWRVDRTAPRHDGVYPGNTPAERRTHHFNQQLTRLLTLHHTPPYALHLGPDPRAPAPRLRRMRDLLAYIDRLRAHHDFVPDRVTANIVVKAWLVNRARGTHGHGEWAQARPGRDGLGKAELRGVFEFVSASMLAEVGRGSGKVATVTDGSVSSDLPFDPSLDFERHVKPFAKQMLRAMRRIGDRDGREVVAKWVERMEGELKGEAKHEEVKPKGD